MNNLLQEKYKEFDLDCSDINDELENETDSVVFDTEAYFFKLIKQNKILTSDETIELFKQLEKAETDNEKARIRDRISTGNAALALYYAAKHYNINKKDSKIELHDLFQEGMKGLLIAIQRFDYKKGFHFSTYAVSWIEREIYVFCGETNSSLRLPRHAVYNVCKINKIKREYEKEHKGQTLSNEQLTKMTGLTQSMVDDVVFCSNPVVSLSAPAGDEDNGDTDLESVISSKENIEDSAIENILHEKVRDLLKENFLSDKERDVIYRRNGFVGLGEIETLESIGRDYNVSRERIRQIEEKAMTKIKLRMKKRGIDKYCLT